MVTACKSVPADGCPAPALFPIIVINRKENHTANKTPLVPSSILSSTNYLEHRYFLSICAEQRVVYLHKDWVKRLTKPLIYALPRIETIWTSHHIALYQTEINRYSQGLNFYCGTAVILMIHQNYSKMFGEGMRVSRYFTAGLKRATRVTLTSGPTTAAGRAGAHNRTPAPPCRSAWAG
jgi:hypothetical protein